MHARLAARRRLAALVALAFAAALPAATRTESILFPVTKTADTADGACDADCSLREAILAANGAPGLDLIQLAIPSEGEPVTIAPTAPLPAITSPVLLDGETQLGATCAGNSLAVEIDGSSAGASADELSVAAPDSVVHGLAIHGFDGSSIRVTASGDTLA